MKAKTSGIVPWELHKCCWGAMADPSGVILLLFSSLHSSICHSIIPHLFYLCSVITCVTRLTFWLLLPDTRLDGMLTMSAKCARWVFWGLGGIHTTSDAKQNLSYCLVDVVVKSLVIGVEIHFMTVFNYSQWFDSFSTFEEIFVKKGTALSCVVAKWKEQNRSNILKINVI